METPRTNKLTIKHQSRKLSDFECWNEMKYHAETLELENVRLREALTRIEKWIGEFPEVEMRDGKMGSYGYAYGSNGERDYMRAVARKALEGKS